MRDYNLLIKTKNASNHKQLFFKWLYIFVGCFVYYYLIHQIILYLEEKQNIKINQEVVNENQEAEKENIDTWIRDRNGLFNSISQLNQFATKGICFLSFKGKQNEVVITGKSKTLSLLSQTLLNNHYFKKIHLDDIQTLANQTIYFKISAEL